MRGDMAMTNIFKPILAASGGALILLLPFAASAKDASITMAQARVIALKAAPGKIVQQEYEKEDGAWRYSFDIRQGSKIHEIGVDAKSGKIVEDSYEKPGSKD